MNILLVIPSLSSYEGGLVSSTINFALALAKQRKKVTLICLEDRDSFMMADKLRESNIEVILIKIKVKYRSPMVLFPLINFFRKNIKKFDICYIHGLWSFPQLVVAYYARKFKIPYIVTVHGMLNPWALNEKRIKKKIYLTLFEKHNLNRAAAIHALTNTEKQHILKTVGKKKDVFVIPNGLWLEPSDCLKYVESKKNSTVLFLGRVHKVKGLDMLIPAFANLNNDYPEWKLVIAGPDEGGYKKTLVELSKKYKIEDKVQFVGKVHGKQKEELFISSGLFVSPSYSEALSVAAIEALRYSLPLLITKTCNFPEVVKSGAGIEVVPSQDAIQVGLEQLIGLSVGQRKEMGKRGFQLIKEKYSMDIIARQLSNKFERILRE